MSSSPNNHVKLLAVACLMALLITEWRSPSAAQDAEADKPPAVKQELPLGKFVTVFSPIDDGQLGRVKNAALSLQGDAIKLKRKAILVVEITQGSSEYHQAYGMAKFLSSVELSKVTTVAWIPKTVTGHNVIVALACNEIIMHPDAELGDVGRGKPLEDEEQRSVLSIVRKVDNLKVSPALAQGMMDPQLSVLKLSLGPAADKITETRVVTQQEARRLRQNKEPILKDQVIWEAGITGKLTGSRARRLDVLITKTCETRLDVAETYDLSAEAMREDPTTGDAPKARVIRIEGMIDPTLEAFVIRQIDRAMSKGVNLLIFEIDSPGGYLLPSENLALTIASLDPKHVRTVAYVPVKTYKGAYSGAAIIALGCDEIYMHPDAQIGDAGPIEMHEGGQFEHAPQKVLSPLRDKLRQLAEKKHRPPAIAEAMADKDLIVYQVTNKQNPSRIWYMTESEFEEKKDEWIKGPVVPESREDNLLTVNGRRAHELKIAERPVHDLDDLKLRLGIPANVKLIVLKSTWIDTAVLVLNHPLSVFLLLVVGVACLYLELHVNSGFLGIVAALCFGIFFWSKFLGGTATWLEVVLFVLGIGCLVLEIFVIPGFGVFGVSGALMVLASLVMASQTFGNLEPNSDIKQMTTTMMTLGASIGTVIAMAMVMNRFLPQIPILNQMVLQPPGMSPSELADEPQLRPSLAEANGIAGSLSVGQTCEVFTDLRPAGKVLLDGQYLDVVSDGPYIGRGQQVEVVSISGNRIVVREA
jgi:membrane-bound serine protease (ClpP class)